MDKIKLLEFSSFSELRNIDSELANEQELFSPCSLVLSTSHASHGQCLYSGMYNMI